MKHLICVGILLTNFLLMQPLETSDVDVPVQPQVQEQVEEEPQTGIYCEWGDFHLTVDEYNLLCTTVFCESGNQDFDTQTMVCLTVLNRYVDGFADSIRDVIYQKNAYAVTGWSDFENRGWTKEVEDAVAYALEVNEHPTDMFYFRTEHYHRFGEPYTKSDDMYFSTEGR